MRIRVSVIATLLCVSGALAPAMSFAAETSVIRRAPHGLIDTDGDGMPDVWEAIFGTHVATQDTDADGHDDWKEVIYGFSPTSTGPWIERDTDGDELHDRLELLFNVDPMDTDSDDDGYADGAEVQTGFDPASTSMEPLKKELRIILSSQRIQQRLGNVVLATYLVSSGKLGHRTPIGEFSVLNKHPRAWSRSASLWMPWWMAFTTRGHGIHELPEWPGGKKEGIDHLGKPVSHGCVRLGIGTAKMLYDWAPVGTAVTVVR